MCYIIGITRTERRIVIIIFKELATSCENTTLFILYEISFLSFNYRNSFKVYLDTKLQSHATMK